MNRVAVGWKRSNDPTPFVKVNPPKQGIKREARPPCAHKWITLHDKMGDEQRVRGFRCELCNQQRWN